MPWTGNTIGAGERQKSQNCQYSDKQKRDHKNASVTSLTTPAAGGLIPGAWSPVIERS